VSEQLDYAEAPELTLGWRIQMALDKGKLQQADLMSKFEVSRGTVSRWCRDIGPAPKKFILNEIAVMCGVPPRWLIDGPKGPGPDDDGGSRLRGSNPAPSHYKATRPGETPHLSRTVIPIRRRPVPVDLPGVDPVRQPA